ncbi:MAG: thiolase family protein [Acidobacteria bacterium]|uniref:Thiolase family protein n=1 Tax=Candidatus Polarisedimenticola svalbardensis TaxID=2886004 RepID=A0A8J7C2J1_9BACT|nr:thiolase family protein [Candidatus Polarisedimenticola svalbardensis]
MTAPSDVVVVAGARTPFIKSWTSFRHIHPVELGRIVAREVVERAEIDPAEVDELIAGNIATPADSSNIARVIQLRAGIPDRVPAFTVNRNCASGLQCLVDAAYRIRAGHADLIVVVAVESMSSVPLLLKPEAEKIWVDAGRSRSALGRLAAFSRLRPSHLVPDPALPKGLTDPVSGLNMGETAEKLAREFGIGREEQDHFALRSHQQAAAAWAEGKMDDEVLPVPLAPGYNAAADRDNGIRDAQTMEALAGLKPIFDRRYGTVTAGNASQITDGAVALVLASRRFVTERMLENMGTIRSWGFAGCDPSRMGLGPVLATPRALAQAGNMSLSRIGLVEINEAFSAQVLACLKAFGSREFSRRHLGGEPVGDIDPSRLNVNGGAIALGHPVGASGGRLVLTLLHEMARRDQVLGLATLCVGGGQGAAMVLERS